MFLSTLLIETGANPDRPRPGRTWLRNMYRVHQRLCMGFPSRECHESDPAFLRPFDPAHFAQGHVHVRRTADSGFLFRVDPLPGGRAAIVVLSSLRPDWGYAFHNAAFLLAAPPEPPRPFQPHVENGSRFRFRLRANAVSRASRHSLHRSGEPLAEKWIGHRIGIAGDDASLRKWIDRRAGPAGFSVRALTAPQAGYVYAGKSHKTGAGYRLRSVLYEGLLEVIDAEAFRGAVISGIGPAKAFGFGLLSIAHHARGDG